MSSATCPEGCSCSSDDSHSVFCSDVQLPDIPLLLDPRTRSLTLQRCHIQKIDLDSIEIYEDLDFLDLSGNEIRTLSSGTFHSQTKLRELRLRKNHITTLQRGAFIGLGNLKILDLSGNLLETVPSQAFQEAAVLEKLDLSSNLITEFAPDALDGLNDVKILNISRNQLESVNLAYLIGASASTLETLDLSHNKISKISNNPSSPHFSSLLNLNLSSNLLTNIDDSVFAATLHLKQVDLSNNLIRTISTLGLRQLYTLEELDLSWNGIEVIGTSSFDGLRSLKKLRMQHLRELRSVQMNGFSGLSSLEQVDLSYCYLLKTVDDNAFETSDKLQSLDLSFCNLQRIPPNLVNWLKLQTLRLNGNPVHCNDEMLDFLPTVLKHFHMALSCSSPSEFSHQDIATLEIKQLPSNRIGLLLCIVGLLTLITVLVITSYCYYQKRTKVQQKLIIPTYTPSSLANSSTYDKGKLLSRQFFCSPSEFSASTTSTSDECTAENYSSPIYPVVNNQERIYETPYPPPTSLLPVTSASLQHYITVSDEYPSQKFTNTVDPSGVHSMLTFNGSTTLLSALPTATTAINPSKYAHIFAAR
uniref:LRRNT domain-containing protein n=1 Tax=Syphacia muris TaxID=451379 RepID=A0A0N5ADB9_9BILA